MTSPTPFVYVHLLNVLIFVFVFSLPLAFVRLLGPVVIPATMFMCLGLYGLLDTAQELENPLGGLPRAHASVLACTQCL